MDTKTRGIITLIKSAVTGESLPLPEGFSLEDAMEQLGRHGLYALGYQGAYCCGIPRVDTAMGILFQHYYIALLQSEGQMAALKALFQAFEEKGIDYLPLKGTILKPLYPRPELRSMGDADILIRMEQYDRIAPIMEELGYCFTEETDHELPWKSRNLYVELHKRLIPSYNQDYQAYYGDGWQLTKHREGHRFSMRAEDAFLYIFSHYAKHYRDGGIGCRQVTDLWVWRRSHPDMDETYIRTEVKKLQLDVFYENTLRLLAVWFGDAEPDEVSEFMTEFIFVSGNFGLLENRVLSQGVKTMKHKTSVRGQWLRHLGEALFPGHDIIDKQYPVLYRHPWLLPVFWVIRWFDKLLFQRDVVDRRRRQLRVFTKEKIDSHEKALQYVGLDYQF